LTEETVLSVGAGLLAIAVCQCLISWLIYRNREQARSHIDRALSGRAYHSAKLPSACRQIGLRQR